MRSVVLPQDKMTIAMLEDPDTLLHGRLGYGEGMETVGAARGRVQSGGWFLGSCLGGGALE